MDVTAGVPTSIAGSRYISSSMYQNTNTTVYNIISIVAALVQPFSLPLSCQSVIVDPSPKAVNSISFGGQCSKNGVSTQIDPACHPPWDISASEIVTTQAGTVLQTIPMYSPATGCPAGYAIACTVAPALHGPLSAQEEALVCCPSSYECSDPVTCSRRNVNTTIVATLCANEPTLTTVTVAAGDLPPYRVGRIIASPIAIVRSPGARNAASKDVGLSSGLQAALGVSISLGAIFLSLAGYLLYRHRKRKTTQKTDEASEIDAVYELHTTPKPTDLEADADDTARHVYELPDTGIEELPPDACPPAELGVKTAEHAGAEKEHREDEANEKDDAATISTPKPRERFSFEANK